MIGKHNAIVVAHPDDETLFAASWPLLHPDKRWTIICLSIPARDPVRAWKFFDACEALGAYGRLMPWGEFSPRMDQIKWNEFDSVVTHNKWGEYGHDHHKYVSDVVRARRPDAITFGYREGGLGDVQHYLKDAALARKEAALDCYDHILPYNDHPMTKANALRVRYGHCWDFALETFDVPV
jgi:LmbE family N-acetylglucosaminyl deacetylase